MGVLELKGGGGCKGAAWKVGASFSWLVKGLVRALLRVSLMATYIRIRLMTVVGWVSNLGFRFRVFGGGI